jgi:hypothetical protein
VTGSNVTAIGGGVVVDSTLGNAIPPNLRTRVASVGIRHGIADHGQAQTRTFVANNLSGPLALANAIGGTGAIKAAVVGGSSLPNGVRPSPVGSVSLQAITDMQATIDAVAGSKPAPNAVDRDGALAVIKAAEAMSGGELAKSPKSLSSVDQGFDAAIATLSKPVQPFDVQDFNSAYALSGTGVRSFASKMAAAELMVRSGASRARSRGRSASATSWSRSSATSIAACPGPITRRTSPPSSSASGSRTPPRAAPTRRWA